MKGFFGTALIVLGVGSLVVLGFWGLILDLRVLHAIGGFWLALAGFILFPAMLIFAPFYAGAVYGYWEPLIVTIAGAVCSWPLIAAGGHLLRKRHDVTTPSISH